MSGDGLFPRLQRNREVGKAVHTGCAISKQASEPVHLDVLDIYRENLYLKRKIRKLQGYVDSKSSGTVEVLKDKLNGAETLVSEYLNRLQAWNTNKAKKITHRRNSEESSLNLQLRLSQLEGDLEDKDKLLQRSWELSSSRTSEIANLKYQLEKKEELVKEFQDKEVRLRNEISNLNSTIMRAKKMRELDRPQHADNAIREIEDSREPNAARSTRSPKLEKRLHEHARHDGLEAETAPRPRLIRHELEQLRSKHEVALKKNEKLKMQNAKLQASLTASRVAAASKNAKNVAEESSNTDIRERAATGGLQSKQQQQQRWNSNFVQQHVQDGNLQSRQLMEELERCHKQVRQQAQKLSECGEIRFDPSMNTNAPNSLFQKFVELKRENQKLRSKIKHSKVLRSAEKVLNIQNSQFL